MNNLKNLVFWIVLVFLLGSCMRKEERQRWAEEANKQKPIIDFANTPKGISIQVIDGCQYIYAETTNGVAIVHKANCNNPTH